MIISLTSVQCSAENLRTDTPWFKGCGGQQDYSIRVCVADSLASSPGCLGGGGGKEKKRRGKHCRCMHQSVPKILVHCKLVRKLLRIQLRNVQLVHFYVYSQKKGVYVQHVAVRVYWYVYERNTEILNV